jgi:hypothetical protein
VPAVASLQSSMPACSHLAVCHRRLAVRPAVLNRKHAPSVRVLRDLHVNRRCLHVDRRWYTLGCGCCHARHLPAGATPDAISTCLQASWRLLLAAQTAEGVLIHGKDVPIKKGSVQGFCSHLLQRKLRHVQVGVVAAAPARVGGGVVGVLARAPTDQRRQAPQVCVSLAFALLILPFLRWGHTSSNGQAACPGPLWRAGVRPQRTKCAAPRLCCRWHAVMPVSANHSLAQRGRHEPAVIAAAPTAGYMLMCISKPSQSQRQAKQSARVGDLDFDDLVVEAQAPPVQFVPFPVHRDAGAAAPHLQALPAPRRAPPRHVMRSAYATCMAGVPTGCAGPLCFKVCSCAAELPSRGQGAALRVSRPYIQPAAACNTSAAFSSERTRSGRAAQSGRARRRCPAPRRAHRPTCSKHDDVNVRSAAA